MDWNTLFNLIDPKLLVVVVACWVLGFVLKKTPRVADWIIVYIVTAFAIVFAILLIGSSPTAVLQGIMCGAFAVYGHQMLKQGKEGVRENEQNI